MHCQHGYCVVIGTKAAGFARPTTLLFIAASKPASSTLMLRSRQTSASGQPGSHRCRTDGKQFRHPGITRKFCQLFIQQRQTALQSRANCSSSVFSTCSTCACWRLGLHPQSPLRRSADQPVCRRSFFRAQHIAVTHCATNDTTQT